MKQLIIEKINDVKFVKSPRVTELGRICSESTGKHALDMIMQQCAGENDNSCIYAETTLKTYDKFKIC